MLKIVSYYYPDLAASEGAGYWCKWGKTFTCNYYYYYENAEEEKMYYNYEGTSWSDEEYSGNLKNMNLIVGENKDYEYVLASKSVKVLSGGAEYNISGIEEGKVRSGYFTTCTSGINAISGKGNYIKKNIRPVVMLPFNTPTEELK